MPQLGGGENRASGTPAFVLGRNLVHFGGYATHIGFYPTSSGVRMFRKELSKYSVATGTVRFKLDEPLPLGLVSRIVKFRVREVSKRRAGSAGA